MKVYQPKAAIKTKGGSGPSGMDADGWRKIILPKSFGVSSNDFYLAFANVTKKICTEKRTPTSIEASIACQHILLEKNQGLRPMGLSKNLKRIIGKAVVSAVKEEVILSVGSLQVCAWNWMRSSY